MVEPKQSSKSQDRGSIDLSTFFPESVLTEKLKGDLNEIVHMEAVKRQMLRQLLPDAPNQLRDTSFVEQRAGELGTSPTDFVRLASASRMLTSAFSSAIERQDEFVSALLRFADVPASDSASAALKTFIAPTDDEVAYRDASDAFYFGNSFLSIEGSTLIAESSSTPGKIHAGVRVLLGYVSPSKEDEVLELCMSVREAERVVDEVARLIASAKTLERRLNSRSD